MSFVERLRRIEQIFRKENIEVEILYYNPGEDISEQLKEDGTNKVIIPIKIISKREDKDEPIRKS